MSRSGWEKWWWHDWLSDTELQSASPITRGIWMNILGHMWVLGTHQLTLTVDQYCRISRCNEADFKVFLDDVGSCGFCDVYTTVTPCHRTLTVVSRRRLRQVKAKENNRLRQQRHRSNARITPTEADARCIEERKEKKSPSHTPPLKKKSQGSAYSSEFECVWKDRPKRSGSDDKRRAWQAWRARQQEGHTTESMADGMKRYCAYCDATDRTGSQFVMLTATFYGPADPPHFTQSWAAPRKSKQPNGRRKTFDEHMQSLHEWGNSEQQDGEIIEGSWVDAGESDAFLGIDDEPVRTTAHRRLRGPTE